jgi:DNA-binding response OmpR family regulator
MYLSGKGFRVHASAGGIDALAFAKASVPDLVVLDLALPDVDGWEVARRLKSDRHTRDIPIIAFSGRTLQHEQVSALRAGCDVYLTKPCAPDKLLGAIRKLLGLADPRVEPAEADREPY